MRRTILLLTLAGAILLACTSVVLAQQATPAKDATKKGSASAETKSAREEPVDGEILVKFKRSTSENAKDQTHEDKEGEQKDTIPKVNVDVVEVPEGEEEQKVAEYETDPDVEFAEPNGTWRALADEPKVNFTSNDPRYGQQYQYPRIEADKGWDVTRGSSSVKIAILDTGIDQSHEDLASKIVLQKDFTGSASSVEDMQGHGTHVAGSSTALSNNNLGVSGTCHDCALMNGKVLNDSGSGSWEGVAEGIIWAADNGAKVINMSLGGTFNSLTVENAVNYAVDTKKVAVVAAAGNEDTNTKSYPAAYDKAIAVGSTDSSDTKSGFSNYGDWVDVAAPGSAILSTAPDHNNAIDNRTGIDFKNYGTISGTSMASPHVAGLAGLIFSKQGLCSDNTCVRQKIESSLTDKSVLNGTSADWSKARINVDKALQGGGTPAPGGCTITGTAGVDFLAGTSGNDVICGLGGDDIIYDTSGGSDTFLGGEGNDFLIEYDSKSGNDTLDGEAGSDSCYALDQGDTRKNCES